MSDPLAAIAQPDTAATDVLVLSAMAGSEEALDLCRKLRRSTSVPILVVGDSTEVEASIRALDAGADDYLAPTTSQRELWPVSTRSADAHLRQGRPTSYVLGT